MRVRGAQRLATHLGPMGRRRDRHEAIGTREVGPLHEDHPTEGPGLLEGRRHPLRAQTDAVRGGGRGLEERLGHGSRRGPCRVDR